MIILKLIFKEFGVRVWTGLIWLRVMFGDALERNFFFHQ
jgi:hypothetical protein